MWWMRSIRGLRACTSTWTLIARSCGSWSSTLNWRPAIQGTKRALLTSKSAPSASWSVFPAVAPNLLHHELSLCDALVVLLVCSHSAVHLLWLPHFPEHDWRPRLFCCRTNCSRLPLPSCVQVLSKSQSFEVLHERDLHRYPFRWEESPFQASPRGFLPSSLLALILYPPICRMFPADEAAPLRLSHIVSFWFGLLCVDKFSSSKEKSLAFDFSQATDSIRIWFTSVLWSFNIEQGALSAKPLTMLWSTAAWGRKRKEDWKRWWASHRYPSPPFRVGKTLCCSCSCQPVQGMIPPPLPPLIMFLVSLNTQEEQKVLEAKIRMQQQERQDEEERLRKRQSLCSSNRVMVPGEVECCEMPSSPIPGDHLTALLFEFIFKY